MAGTRSGSSGYSLDGFVGGTGSKRYRWAPSGPVVLVATRAGVGDYQLVNANGLAPYSTAGGNPLQYDDAVLGDRIIPDPFTSTGTVPTTGTVLGLGYPYCDVMNRQPAFISIASGSPQNLARNQQRDSGFTPTGSDRLLMQGGTWPTYRTILCEVQAGALGDFFTQDTPADASISLRITGGGGGRLRLGLFNSAGVLSETVVGSGVGLLPAPIKIGLSFDDPTVGGNYYWAVWDNTGALWVSGSAALAATPWAPRTVTGSVVGYQLTEWKHWVATYTDAQMVGFGAAGFPAPDVNLIGIRSTCYRPAAPTELPIRDPSGAGADVTARPD